MDERTIRKPGPDHPITIEKNPSHLVVSVAGHVIADTHHALDLREANYPVVHYIPRSDVSMPLLQRTTHLTYCPYKGECAYFSIPVGGVKSVNAVWSYEEPYHAVLDIKEYLAFYPNRIDSLAVML
jgi:uncharacterized protein (DUF427 family)